MRFSIVLLLATACACGPGPGETIGPGASDSARPAVVVSVAPLADLARRVLGDAADVLTLLPPAANPTTFEPSMSTMAELERAELVLRVGHAHFPLESTWLTPSRAGERGRVVVDCVDGGRDEDPHVWWDPAVAAACATRLADAWIAARPASAATVRSRLAALLAELDARDAAAARRFEPYRERTFLVFHPAWGRFAARYDLRQLAVESHGHEPNAADLASTIEAARDAGVVRIYSQPQFSPRGSTLVAAETGARQVDLDPLASDWFGGFDAAVDTLIEGFRAEDASE
ncbi:MAG: zinc ABC transporter substrate-binding protein [Planctomycetota bacterium]|nr:zinc ABC transporter substrate-binding protein [Planctomycetota bacterium]